MDFSTSSIPDILLEGPLEVSDITPPVTSPYLASTPPMITWSCSISDCGMRLPVTLTPSKKYTVSLDLEPLTEMSPPSRDDIPADVAAMAFTCLVGRALIFSAVTVVPCVVLSCSIRGTLNSLISTGSSNTASVDRSKFTLFVLPALMTILTTFCDA